MQARCPTPLMQSPSPHNIAGLPHATAAGQHPDSPAAEAAAVPLSQVLPKATVAMFAAGAALGPLLDGMHSKNDVLHYHDPLHITAGAFELETCW